MIDSDGFRPNVGIILANDEGRVLWARRVGGQDAWQFPQGGISQGESTEDALFRELHEEVGLQEQDVKVLASTGGWLRYRLPNRMVRRNSTPVCIGQKQKWFLLQTQCDDSRLDFNCGDKSEFDYSRWVSYWYPLGNVVAFKREVYLRALKELSPAHSRLEMQLNL